MEAQNHLSISWQVTPEQKDYAATFARNAWQLDAARQTREFRAHEGGKWRIGSDKDSLNGKDEAIAGGAHLRKET